MEVSTHLVHSMNEQNGLLLDLVFRMVVVVKLVRGVLIFIFKSPQIKFRLWRLSFRYGGCFWSYFYCFLRWLKGLCDSGLGGDFNWRGDFFLNQMDVGFVKK